MHRNQQGIATSDTMALSLVALFVFLVLYVIVVRFVLYFRLRSRIAGLSFFFSSTVGYLEAEYLRHRKTVGSRGLDWLVWSALASFVLVFVVGIIIFNWIYPAL